ncbi:D-alanyl-D-alanine carboxypeptidase family protein [Paenibacillus sp. GCM10027627]|uniref:D-alanyl-D-alanine carboxypeptidase family protein n=1 Tax=unclassified Paenibacillus TaxID=185978 RepID=UPI003640AA0D
MIRVSKAKPRYGWHISAIATIAVAVYLGTGWVKSWVAEDGILLSASAAILIDAETGEVLYEKNAHEALPPASMSKMMTEIIVLDQIREGTIQWGDSVTASLYAENVPGSQMGLSAGQALTIRELFDAMTIYSANDAAVALAEHISGTEESFVALMNEKGRRIGLSGVSAFGNSTGLSRTDIAPLPGASHKRDTALTARDTAMLAGYLIGKYPEVLAVTSQGSVKVSTQGKTLSATNLMLEDKPFAYPGNDGLKTGYTPNAGYCFTGTAKRNGKRLISVVMGAKTMETRFLETMQLYELGFSSGVGSGLKAAIGNSN